MAQQERAVRTRRAIVDAAGEVFAEQGYGSARISDVYRRAGVTKGAFYFHFTSKEELAQEVLDTQVAYQVETLSPRSDVKLQASVDAMMLVAHRLTFDGQLQGSIRLAIDKGSPLNRKRPYHDWIEFHLTLLKEADQHGELQSHVDIELFAETIVGAFAGVQLMSEVMTGRSNVEERIAYFCEVVLPAIALPEIFERLEIYPDLGRRLLSGELS